jgi:hypothetical protein
MSTGLRAWLISVSVILAGNLGLGLLAETDPDDWLLRVVSVLVLALALVVVGLWYLRRRPDATTREYALSVAGFPVLFSLLVLALRIHGDATTKDVLISTVFDVLVLVLVPPAVRLRARPQAGGYR